MSLSERIAEVARAAHLAHPCAPARPGQCVYCRDAARTSGAIVQSPFTRRAIARDLPPKVTR